MTPRIKFWATLLIAVLCTTSAFADDHGSAGHGAAGHKEVAVSISSGEEETATGKKHGAKALGLEFVYRISDEWGVGGVVERLDVHGKRNTVVVVPVSYHFGGGFRAFAGPGYEFNAQANKDKALIRIGLGYAFHINDHWSISPEVVNDFLNGHGDTWLAGIAIGYGF
jgi:hypothetical protein